MVELKTVLQKFGSQGEKSGWTYVEIPAKVAAKIKPGTKKSFRIKGKINGLAFKGALMPMGGGDFIFAVKSEIRKKIKKFSGDEVVMSIEEDKAPPKLNKDLLACLAEDEMAKAAFSKFPPSHKAYFSKWVDEAKTENTRAKRIAMSLQALSRGMDFGQMLREARDTKLRG